MSKLTPVVAANWKMFKTPQESYSFVESAKIKLLDIHEVNIILCAPYTSLFHISSLFTEEHFQLGAQNMYFEEEGAFTGEISPRMLSASGVEWVILGHSERRHIFGESNDDIRKKLVAANRSGLRPILCVGETLEERQNNETESVLKEQLGPILNELDEDKLKNMLFAYEPVWAIGTGVNAEPDQIEDAHKVIREVVGEKFPDVSADIGILYGGSVKPGNAADLIAVEGVDGFLVGGASLELDSFMSIIESVEKYECEKK